MEKKLYRSKKNKILAGVCGGLAEYFNIDATIIRILFVILGVGLLVYVVLAFIVPENPGTQSDEPVATPKSQEADEWETPNPSAAKIAQEDEKNNNNNTFTLG